MEDLPPYTPQAISDILPIYRPQDSDSHIRIYDLRQTCPSTLNLSLREDHTTSSTSYEIKSNKTGGFMNRKPHVIVTAINKGQLIAEGRYDIHGTGMTITYPHLEPQRLELENSLAQVLRTQIHGSDFWWQPHPGNKGVLELTNETEEIVARFVYTATALQRAGSWSERSTSASDFKKDRVEFDLGDLHVVDALVAEESGHEQIICGAIMVIERAKRRAENMAKNGPALKGPASWGMSISPPGGFT